jgi:hypothetical protein
MADFELSTPAGDAVRNKYRREGAVAELNRITALLEDYVARSGNRAPILIEVRTLIRLLEGYKNG